MHPRVRFRATGAVVAAAALVVLAACSGGSGTSAPLDGVIAIAAQSATEVRGSFALTGETEEVTFVATVQGDEAGQAVYTLPDGARLVADVTGPGEGTVTWGGVTLDGHGAPTAEEAAALAEMDSALAGQAIRSIPLAVGCGAPDLGAAAVAALVLPWQLVLKYRVPDAAADAQAFGTASSCGYFAALTDDAYAEPAATSLILSRDAPWPVAFGFFPLDEEGLYEPALATATGALAAAPIPADPAPCGALCRGACGVDCTTTNCSARDEWRCDVDDAEENDGFKRRWRLYDCGIHGGCLWHDDCYDTCNASHPPCGSKRAAFCRHNTVNGCDVTAAYHYGHLDCALWATGRGTFAARQEFAYEIPGTRAADPVECPPPDGGDGGDGGGDGGDGGDGAPVFAALAETDCVDVTVYGYHVFVGEENGAAKDDYYLMLSSCHVGDANDPTTWPTLTWSGGGFSVHHAGTDAQGNAYTLDISGSVAADGQSLAAATARSESAAGQYSQSFTVSNLTFGGNLNPALGIQFAVDGPDVCPNHVSDVSASYFSYTQVYTYDRTEWHSDETSRPWVKVRFAQRPR